MSRNLGDRFQSGRANRRVGRWRTPLTVECLEAREVPSTLGVRATKAPPAAVRSAAVAGPPILLRSDTTQGILTLNGQPIRLIGYSDLGIVAETAFDHRAFLSTVADRYGVNLIRIWVPYHFANDLTPFQKTQGGTNPKYKLESFNDGFFKRLRAVVQDAQSKGVVVQVCLFDAVMLEDNQPNRWNYSPYRDARNTDVGFLKDGSQKSTFLKVGDKDEVWTKVNRELIRRTVAALGDLGNVIYEVMNEPGGHGLDEDATLAFHKKVVAALASDLAGKPGSKVISVNAGSGSKLYDWAKGEANVGLISIHVGQDSPSDASNAKGLALSKPVLVSNDGNVTNHTYAQGLAHGLEDINKLQGDGRANYTLDLLGRTFDGEARYGHMGFEFLDKGLNGTSWRSGDATTAPDYQPRATSIDAAVLNRLATFAPGRRPTHAANLAADYTGDGAPDFAVWRPSDGNWFVRNSANGATQVVQWGLFGDVPVPGDYDRDGVVDAAVWRPSDGNWYLRQSRGGVQVVQWGLFGDVPVPGDYDGDGAIDLAVWRPSNGTWYVRSLANAKVTTTQLGLPTDVPAPADFDGDGKLDRAVWRPGLGTAEQGNWYIVSSRTGVASVAQFGLFGDVPVPGDFDRDGKADLAVWRPGRKTAQEGNWYLRNSSNGQVQAIQWGLATDLAAPGVFVRSGPLELAVWRPTDGVWYRRKVAGGATSTQQFGLAEDFPLR